MHTDIPTRADLERLLAVRDPACVSIYVPTTPGYWYYCPSAEAYYPYVKYCLDAWVPVPVQ